MQTDKETSCDFRKDVHKRKDPFPHSLACIADSLRSFALCFTTFRLNGFVTEDSEILVKKVEAEFENTTMDTPIKTAAFKAKIQRRLRQLHKDGKRNYKTCKECYPSGSTTPTASVTIEAHKPEKDCPVHIIISHIGAPQEKLATYLGTKNSPFVSEIALHPQNLI